MEDENNSYNKCDDSENINEKNTNNEDENNESSNTNEGNASYKFKWCGGDMPFGFQKVNPQVFNVIGEILGDVMSNRLPFNVQNAVGNWIQLIGQIIECYSSQQNYFQSGPGRYYDIKYYNVSNPFCTDNDGDAGSENSSDNNGSTDDDDEIENLKNTISEMQNAMKNLEDKINTLEKNK